MLLDLRGDGISLTGAEAGVRFDLAGSGIARQIAWTQPGTDDAFLFLDRNGNGTVDNGTELFGDATPQPATQHRNGFAALAVFDRWDAGGNGDGAIGPEDAVFLRLRVWRDSNHNGMSESDEIRSLAEAGVGRVSLHVQEHRFKDQYGNQFRYRVKLTVSDASSVDKWAYDVFLVGLRSGAAKNLPIWAVPAGVCAAAAPVRASGDVSLF